MLKPSKDDTAAERDPESLLAQIETNIGRPRFCIGFDKALEGTFQNATEPVRVRHFMPILAVTAILYDLFIVPHRLMVPDAFGLALFIQFGFVTPTVFCVLFCLWRQKISSVWAAVAVIAAITVAELTIMHGSRAPNAILTAFGIPMMIVFCAVLPLPFCCAFYLSLASVAAIGFAVCTHPGFDVGSGLFAFAVAFCMMIFTSLAAYKLETRERRAFLLTFAEATRVSILARDNRLLHKLSHRDGMTGLGNRRFFDATLERLWNTQIKCGLPIALLMIDIDHFKQLNDIQGHLSGDQCICAVADLIAEVARTDVACRFGGDEFAILLSGLRSREAASIAERLRVAVQTMPVEANDSHYPALTLSVSIGHAILTPDENTTSRALIEAADRALYRAKQVGRNRVYPHSSREGFSPLDRPMIASGTRR